MSSASSWIRLAERLTVGLAEAAMYWPLVAVWSVAGHDALAGTLTPAWVMVAVLAGQAVAAFCARLEYRKRRLPVLAGLLLAGLVGFLAQPGARLELLYDPGLGWAVPPLVFMLLWLRGLVIGTDPVDAEIQQGRFLLGLVVVAASVMLGQATLPPGQEFGQVAGPYVIIYLLLGLAAMTMARLSELRQEGRSDREFRLSRYWPAALIAISGLVLAMALLVSAFLPGVAGSLSPFLKALGRGTAAVLDVMLLPLAYLAGALVWLLRKLLRPFQSPPPDAPLGPPDDMPWPDPQELRPVPVTLQWVAIVAIVVALSALALYYMLRLRQQVGDEWDEERVSTWSSQALASWWKDVVSGWKNRAQETLSRLAPARRGPPADLVELYHRLEERAASLGHPRPRHATPHEYLPGLEAAFPEHGTEVTAITGGFVHHYYSSTSPEGPTWEELFRAWLSVSAWEPPRPEKKKLAEKR